MTDVDEEVAANSAWYEAEDAPAHAGPSRGGWRRFLRGDGRYRLISIASPFVALAVWQVVVVTNVLDERFFPTPISVADELGSMIANGDLWHELSISLQRIFIGFAIGAASGLVLGLLMGWFKSVRAFLNPIISATYPIPKIALLPLFLVIFGLGETPKIVTVATAAFFLQVITTYEGVARIDPVLIQAGQNYGAKGHRLFTKIILPASLPAIWTGLRLALGVSLLIIVAAEFVDADRGIGRLIWISWQTLAVERMYVGLVVIAALGIIFTSLLGRVGKLLMPWGQDIQDRTR